MATFKVSLGGREYDLRPLNIKQAKQWRAQFAEPFSKLTGALAGAGKIELDNGTQLAGLIQTLSGTLIGSTDILIEMIFAYSPELQADRERIESEATDAEAMAAFVEVLKAAYPFTSLLSIVQAGQQNKTTSKK